MSIAVGTSTAQTPLQRNFGGLKRYIVDYVQGGSDPDLLDVAARAINAGIDVLNVDVWQFTLKTQTLTLSASDDTYTLNNDFKKPRKLFRLNSSSRRDGWINYKAPKSFFDEEWRSATDGDPIAYTVPASTQDATLLLSIAPSSTFIAKYPTLQLRYFSRMQHLANDSDVMSDIAAPPEIWMFLGWYGRWEMAAVRGASAVHIDRAFAMWNRTYRDLRRDNNATNTDWEL